MNIVDSSGWLEYFADAPNADFFEKPLYEDLKDLRQAKSLEKNAPSVSLAEAKKQLGLK